MLKLKTLPMLCCSFVIVSCHTVLIKETEDENYQESEQVIVIIEQPIIIHPPPRPHPLHPRPPKPPTPPEYSPDKKKPIISKPVRKRPSEPIIPSRPVRKNPKEIKRQPKAKNLPGIKNRKQKGRN